MGCVVITTLEAVVVIGLLWLACLKGTDGQMQNPVIALEGADVELTVNIPNSQVANNANFIAIRHSTGSGQMLTDVLYSSRSTIKVTDDYAKLLEATQIGKRLTLRVKNVVASLAGTFRCYLQGSNTTIDDCGQLLIIIRKPNPPTIKILPSSVALAGSRLALLCATNTTSLPPNHGLASQIWWQDQSGQPVPQGSQRIHVSAQNQLVIDPLERADKGLKFYCVSADSTGDVAKDIKSERSAVFEVLPEYKPSVQDFVFTPALENTEAILKGIGDQINYRCAIDCSPRCSIVWMNKPITGSADFGELSTLADKEVLAFSMSKTNDGLYKCKAENIHGAAEQGFRLEASYLEAPTISINEENKSSHRLPENSQVSLKCVYDSYPAPVVNWISPSQNTLHIDKAVATAVEGGSSRPFYGSTFVASSLKCEDSGLYRCDGRHGFGSAEGRIELEITCPPSSANVPGPGLKDEYAWEISKPLSFEFVIRAFPEPSVTQIVSSLNGVVRNELIPKDVELSKTLKYDGKSYLTKFVLTSKRVLDQNDADRVYTMTVVSSEFKTDFVFQIHPRGPPHKVVNLTVTEVGHDSLIIFWLPGFSGGEPQTFSVEHRVPSQSDLPAGAQQQENYSWTSSSGKVPDGPPDNWIRVKVPSLSAETDYVFRVTAINALGSSVAEIKIKTAVEPSSLGAGAICGIVFGVLIILVIVAVVIYFFIIRKRLGKSRAYGGARQGPLHQIFAFFRKDKHKTRPVTAARQNGSATNESHWGKVRKMFVRSPLRNSEDYLNVPPRDYNIEYSPGSDSALNNNALSPGTPESGRKMNDEGLVYVEVDFPGDKQKNTNKKQKDKKKKKKKEDVHKSNESVSYSDIDFSKTADKRKELEEEEKRREEEEEPEYEDDASAALSNKYADAGFSIGTTV